MQNIFEAKNISKAYSGHQALNDVSIAVPEKSVFGLLGPNGAGKTSLIRIINQITGPDTGELIFDGKKMVPDDVQQIGYLPEERGLYKKMKVGEQAMYLARLKGMDRKVAFDRLKEWFHKFEMESWWNKKVEELSKGMQQKVQFIVTVVHQPKLLILDEPFSGFDPINTNLIKSEILKLRDEGSTVIFSTHNMESVEEICDHIALINRSRVILDGSVNDVRNSFKSRTFEVVFKGEMIGFTTALWTGFELIDSSKKEDCIIAKIKMLEGQTVNNLLNALLPAVEIQSVQEIVPSMNDIFISKVTEMNMPVTETPAS